MPAFCFLGFLEYGMKKFLICLLFFTATLFSADITATTSDGRFVILHENGRWEFYQHNKKVRDVRESAIPEDIKFQVTIQYESYEKLRKDTETYLEALEFSSEQIKDSVRTLPRGGIVHFCVPTEQIKKAFPRTFVYSVWNGGKSPVYQETIPDSLAKASGIAGTSYLASVPIYGKLKKSNLKARVQSPDGKQTLDFDVPVK